MKRKYTIGLFGQGLDKFAKGLEDYAKWFERKTDEFAKRLADMGALNVQFNLEGAVYSGNTDFNVKVEGRGKNQYAVIANGRSILFVEFGAGARHGYGHPLAGDLGMGPGTYPGQGHWDDPNGWWYETDDSSAATHTSKKSGKSWVHTYGNPPNAPMYNSVKELEQELERVVREVFSD